MPSFNHDGLRLYFEQHGARADTPVLLIHDLTCQIAQWPPDLVSGLVAAGLRVILMDNRDVGRSGRIDCPVVPDIEQILKEPRPADAPYTLRDMATDAVALLDHLGQAGAHLIGVSMGAAIAQHVAIEFPERVFSLTTLMAGTGNPQTSPPDPAAVAGFLSMPQEDRDGFKRQLLALLTDGDRTGYLPRIAAPALVVHGREDPLVPVAAAEALAAAIPDARLVIVDRMGHDLPDPLLSDLVGLITAHVNAAQSRR